MPGGEPAGITRTRARRTALVIPMNVGGFKSKDPVTNGYQDLIVSLRDRISNPLLQTLDALSALYQLIKGKFTLTFSPGTA